MRDYIKIIEFDSSKANSVFDISNYKESGLYIVNDGNFSQLMLYINDPGVVISIIGWYNDDEKTKDNCEKVICTLEQIFRKKEISNGETKSDESCLQGLYQKAFNQQMIFVPNENKISENFVLKLVELITRK